MKNSQNVIGQNEVKNSTSKKALDLNNKETKEKFFEAKKESIKNNSLFDNLDFLNLHKQTSTINIEKQKSVNEKHFIYKFERLNLGKQKEQSLRQKIRKSISNKIDNIIFYFNAKNEVELKKSISEFKDYYIETYILNDYSINSIYANHIGDEKMRNLKLSLEIIKLIK